VIGSKNFVESCLHQTVRCCVVCSNHKSACKEAKKLREKDANDIQLIAAMSACMTQQAET
jgi:hypothetical protein